MKNRELFASLDRGSSSTGDGRPGLLAACALISRLLPGPLATATSPASESMSDCAPSNGVAGSSSTTSSPAGPGAVPSLIIPCRVSLTILAP